MKTIINIFIFAILILGISCKKNKTQAAPPPATNTNNTSATPTLSAQEQSLVGYWIMDSSIRYISNVRQPFLPGYSIIHTNSLSCKVELKNAYLLNNPAHVSNHYLDAFTGLNGCQVTNQHWNATNANYLNLAKFCIL
ncbi:MAG: hypothetical protein IPI93_11950 [Sphingobacteriaceae bacterium]|nr:hypothetical protein [Sphingobacteriaceae bacterium]